MAGLLCCGDGDLRQVVVMQGPGQPKTSMKSANKKVNGDRPVKAAGAESAGRARAARGARPMLKVRR